MYVCVDNCIQRGPCEAPGIHTIFRRVQIEYFKFGIHLILQKMHIPIFILELRQDSFMPETLKEHSSEIASFLTYLQNFSLAISNISSSTLQPKNTFEESRHNYFFPPTNSSYLLNSTNHNYSLVENVILDILSAGTKANESQSTSYLPSVYPVWAFLLIIIATIITSIITIGGNVLVVTSFFIEKNLQNATNYFIISLAVTDIIIGMISMPFYSLTLLLGYWPLGNFICDMWLSLDYTVCLTSQYTVFFITLDRFFSVKIPARYRLWRTPLKIKYMIVLAWVIPIILFFTTVNGWPLFIGYRNVPPKQCYVGWIENPLYNIILIFSYYWLTLVILLILYAAIYKVAYSLAHKAIKKEKEKAKMLNFSKNNIPKSRTVTTLLSPGAENEATPAPLLPSSTNFEMKKMANSASPLLTHKGEKKESLSESLVVYSDEEEENSSSNAKSVIILNQKAGAKEQNKKRRFSSSGALLKKKNNFFSKRMPKPRVKSKKEERKKSKSENRAIKAFKTITLIMGAYVLCWSPWHILETYRSFSQSGTVNELLYEISYWLCYLNSPLNPFMYALANPQFKTTMLKLLRCDI